MKNIVGIVFVICGLLFAYLITFFYSGCGAMANEPIRCTIESQYTYLIGLFYIIAGIGIGLLIKK